MALPPPNLLYYGDNLPVLRRHVPSESIDLIYLDPPFNSAATYNALFEEADGTRSPAQIEAFTDTWRWDVAAASAYSELLADADHVSDAMVALRTLAGESDMLAYLVMMASRLKELRRVLKSTGSIYLHCDTVAVHYLKVLMDSIFGPECFKNEIIWKRTSGHSDARRWGRVHDTILYYARAESPVWNQVYQAYDRDYEETYYRYKDPDGRRFMSGDLSAAGLQGGGYSFEINGITRVWRVSEDAFKRLEEAGRIFYTKNGFPRLKRYLDEAKGLPGQDVWTDIEALRSWHKEKLGYPTQKPQALLERIITASSNEGDIVLDPFCGCGTTVHAAEALGRRWIGIDITHLAINLIRHRLTSAFDGKAEFKVVGEPEDLPSAEVLAKEDPYQFQFWALGLVSARPTEEKKGADRGIDGRLFFRDEEGAGAKDKKIIISVKAGKVSVPQVRDLRGVLDREKAEIGVLITWNEPTKPMRTEAASAGIYRSPGWGTTHPRVQILTIHELLVGKGIDYPRSTATTLKSAPGAKKASAVEDVPMFGAGGEPAAALVSVSDEELISGLALEPGDDEEE